MTEGITQALTERELKGVLAHELSHVRHRDILIGSVAAAVAMGITFVARIAFWGALFGGGNDDEDNNVVGALLMMVLAPVAAGLVQMAISRSRSTRPIAAAPSCSGKVSRSPARSRRSKRARNGCRCT